MRLKISREEPNLPGVTLDRIRGFLSRELENAERAAEMARAQRLAMAASIAGLRAELAMLEKGGPPDLTEITRNRLEEATLQLERFEREVVLSAEMRRQNARERANRFEAFVERVITA